jgi:hypothetical protein
MSWRESSKLDQRLDGILVGLREKCLVVSFHEDEGADHEEDE